MYGYTSVLIMAEAKRRKNLGIPPREKNEDINLPTLDKMAIQQKVRSTLYKYPIIPFLFYGAAILILIGGLFFVFKSFNISWLPGLAILIIISLLFLIFKILCLIQLINFKDFKNNLETSREEWNQILDLADKNYLKCMGIPYY